MRILRTISNKRHLSDEDKIKLDEINKIEDENERKLNLYYEKLRARIK